MNEYGRPELAEAANRFYPRSVTEALSRVPMWLRAPALIGRVKK